MKPETASPFASTECDPARPKAVKRDLFPQGFPKGFDEALAADLSSEARKAKEELTRIAEAWPDLPPEARRSIFAILEAFRGSGR